MAASDVLRHLLIVDWATIENTPPGERFPDRLYRWRKGAERLAAREGLEVGAVVTELQRIARNRVAREREAVLADLARDLAVNRALGKRTAPPWQRRLSRIASVMDVPLKNVRDKVERMAARVRVEIAS
jgi:hypothetical protein